MLDWLHEKFFHGKSIFFQMLIWLRKLWNFYYFSNALCHYF
jgi:hypothetical protein